MQRIERLTSPPGWLRHLDSLRGFLRSVRVRRRSAQAEESRSTSSLPDVSALKIAGYSLVLMDIDGQVIWTREWDSGGVFEFGPRQRLWVFCGFTNHSARETEISEYEVELMGEDGTVIERFGNSFGDSVIVPPGESKHFTAEWKM